MKLSNDNLVARSNCIDRPQLVIQALVTAVCFLGIGIGRQYGHGGLPLIDHVADDMREIAKRHGFSERDTAMLTNTIEIARESALKAARTGQQSDDLNEAGKETRHRSKLRAD